jgi:hypothetical protein
VASRGLHIVVEDGLAHIATEIFEKVADALTTRVEDAE